MIIHDISDDAVLGPDGLVRDGHGIRVSKMMRDSVDRRGTTVLHGGGGYKPGFIVAADSSMYDAAEAARRQWIVDTCNAWRSDADRQSGDAAPPRGPIADPAEAQRVCREARDRYIRELQDAWRR
jgi:hypothetical protein